MVSIHHVQINHNCGGSIVTPWWVLTAGHCVADKYGNLRIRFLYRLIAGSTYTISWSRHVQVRYVKKLYVHPKFLYSGPLHDIGMMKVKEKFNLNDYVRTIKLPAIATDDENAYAGCPATVMGWGRVSTGGRTSNVLKRAFLKVIDLHTCRHKLRNKVVGLMFMCTLGGSENICKGDSGGPLMCEGIQVGIVSWGVGCEPESPGVYTRVDTYLRYINETINAVGRNMDSIFFVIAIDILVLVIN